MARWKYRSRPPPSAGMASDRREPADALAEAFITAAGKPEPLPAGQDAADAAAAGLALAEVLGSSGLLTSTVRCSPQDPFNLLAAMALWAGLRIDHAELHAEVLVVAARPAPQAQRS